MSGMLQQFNPSDFFRLILTASAQAVVLMAIVLTIKLIFRSKLSSKWYLLLWLVVLVRLALPVSVQSNLSLFTLFKHTAITASQPATQPDTTSEIAETTPVPAPAPAYSTIDALPAANSVSTGAKAVNKENQLPQNTHTISKLKLAAIIWIGGMGIFAFIAALCNLRFYMIIRTIRPLTNGKILDLLEDCKTQLGISTIVGVIVTDKVNSPALFGSVRPRLLLPPGVANSATKTQLRHIFLHELAHLKRGDIYLGWAMVFLQILHWFNPFVWLAFKKIRTERELACDEHVLSRSRGEEPSLYGNTLIDIFENFSELKSTPGIAGILENKSQLRRRIKMIAGFKPDTFKSSAIAAALIAVIAIVGLTNAKSQAAPGQESQESKVKVEVKLSEQKDLVKFASGFTKLLVQEDFVSAAEHFDTNMKHAVSQKQLKTTWQSTILHLGSFKGELGQRSEKLGDLEIVIVTCEFEKGPLDIKIVRNQDNKVSGLFLLPVPTEVLDTIKLKAAAAKAKSQHNANNSANDTIPFTDSFETGTLKPDGWEYGPSIDGVNYIWDKRNASDGNNCLRFVKTAKKYFPIAQWHKTCRHSGDAKYVRLEGMVKAHNAHKAVLDVLFKDKDNNWLKHQWISYIGGDKSAGIEPASHDWKKYSGTAEIPEDTEYIIVSFQMYGPGVAMLDELKVTYTDKPDPNTFDKDKFLKKDLVISEKPIKAATKITLLPPNAAIRKLDAETANSIRDFESSFRSYFQPEKEYIAASSSQKAEMIDKWIEQVFDIDRETRCRAIASLGNVRAENSVETLLKVANEAMGHNRPKWMAVRSLGNIGDPRAIETLIELVDHGNLNVQVYARFGLARITGMAFEDNKRKWQSWWEHSKSRYESAEIVIADEESVNVNNEETQLRFKRVLSDSAAINRLDKETSDQYKSFERFFLGLFPIDRRHEWESKQNDEKAIAGWIELVSGPDSDQRNEAIAALGAVKCFKSSEILAKIISSGNRNNRQRWLAARSLAYICDPESVPTLIDALDHYNKNVRIYARFALVKMTNLNFEDDKNKWIEWWAQNKDRLTIAKPVK